MELVSMMMANPASPMSQLPPKVDAESVKQVLKEFKVPEKYHPQMAGLVAISKSYMPLVRSLKNFKNGGVFMSKEQIIILSKKTIG